MKQFIKLLALSALTSVEAASHAKAADAAKAEGPKMADGKPNPKLTGNQKCCNGDNAACKACKEGKDVKDFCAEDKNKNDEKMKKSCPKKVEKRPPTKDLCKKEYDEVKADFSGNYNSAGFKAAAKELEKSCNDKWTRCKKAADDAKAKPKPAPSNSTGTTPAAKPKPKGGATTAAPAATTAAATAAATTAAATTAAANGSRLLMEVEGLEMEFESPEDLSAALRNLAGHGQKGKVPSNSTCPKIKTDAEEKADKDARAAKYKAKKDTAKDAAMAKAKAAATARGGDPSKVKVRPSKAKGKFKLKMKGLKKNPSKKEADALEGAAEDMVADNLGVDKELVTIDKLMIDGVEIETTKSKARKTGGRRLTTKFRVTVIGSSAKRNLNTDPELTLDYSVEVSDEDDADLVLEGADGVDVFQLQMSMTTALEERASEFDTLPTVESATIEGAPEIEYTEDDDGVLDEGESDPYVDDGSAGTTSSGAFTVGLSGVVGVVMMSVF